MRKIRETIEKYDWGTFKAVWDVITVIIGIALLWCFTWIFYTKVFG